MPIRGERKVGEHPRAPSTLVELNQVPAVAALVDTNGAIQAVNAAWIEFGLGNGAIDPGAAIGWSYSMWLDAPDVDAARAAAGVFAVIDGAANEFSFSYPCHSPTEKRWFRFLVVPAVPGPAPRSVLAVHLPLGPGVNERLHALTNDVVPLPRLSGPFVVVCAWCSVRSRAIDGRWIDISPDHAPVGRVSHGICPACLLAADPDL